MGVVSVPALENRVLSAARASVEIVGLQWAIFSDFGDLYTSATLASALASVADHNASHGTAYCVDAFIGPKYDDYAIIKASQRIVSDLEKLLDSFPHHSLSVAFVVDPLKDRRNVLSVWEYEGKRVYLAHPDHGQVSGLIDSAHDPASKWRFITAYEINKDLIPDSQIRKEVDQLWDGHAAYAWAAILARIYDLEGKLSCIGTEIADLRYYPKEVREQANTAQELRDFLVDWELRGSDPSERIAHPLTEKLGLRNFLVHYIGNLPAFEDFVRRFPVPEDAIVQFVRYPVQGDTWRDAAASIYFAGINALQDADCEQIIVHEQSPANHYALVQLKEPTHDSPMSLMALVPDNQSGTLLFSEHIYPPISWKYYAKQERALADALEPGLFLPENDRPLNLNGAFKVKQISTSAYETAALGEDANGNIKFFFNPHKYGIDWGNVTSVDIYYMGQGYVERPFYIGCFGPKINYTPAPEGMVQHALNASGMCELGVILNPARAGDGNQITRRPNLEAMIPMGHLGDTLRKHQGIDVKTGDRFVLYFREL